MIRKINQQVSPKAAAAIILTVLILIQVVWWRGLVMKPPLGPAHGGPSGGPGGKTVPPVLVGRKDVLVTTLSGSVEPGDTDGPGHSARFDTPTGLALDAQGSLYVADSLNHRIRIVAQNGATSTLAGSVQGYADGPLAAARFSLPCGVAAAPDGAVYVADTGNHRIRRIKDGQVTTLAGNVPGTADGQGSAVEFNSPCALTYVGGSKPGLLVADALNHRVRFLTLAGAAAGGWQQIGPSIGILGGATAAEAAPGVPGAKALQNAAIDMQGEPGTQADFTLRHPLSARPAPGGWFVIDGEHSALFYVHDGKADVVAGHCQGRIRPMGWTDGGGDRAMFGQLAGLIADGQGHLYLSDTSNNLIRRITLPADLAAEDGRGFSERRN